jgi:hypothetical protein
VVGPVNGAQHYAEAERLLAAVTPGTDYGDGTPVIYDEPARIAAAQVHATLALAAATALLPRDVDGTHVGAWFAAAGGS